MAVALTIDWGFEGVFGAAVMVGMSLVSLLVAFGYADEGRPRFGRRVWIRTWRPALFLVVGIFCAVMSASGFWGATHVRTQDFTVERLREDGSSGGWPQQYIDDTTGESFNTPRAIHVRAQEGDRMRCEMTSPLLILQRRIRSCARLHTRYSAATAMRAARKAAVRALRQ